MSVSPRVSEVPGCGVGGAGPVAAVERVSAKAAALSAAGRSDVVVVPSDHVMVYLPSRTDVIVPSKGLSP